MRMNQLKSKRGFTLIELMVVVATLVILWLLFMPTLTKSKTPAKRIACVSNLKQVGMAFRIWAGEHNDLPPMSVSVTNGGVMELAVTGNITAIFQVMSNELSTPKILLCPTDIIRRQATTFATTVPPENQNVVPFQGNTSLSYFVNLDAEDKNPSMFLTGDDNLLIGGRRDVALGGVPATTGVLTLTTNDVLAWSEARHEKQGNVALADGSEQQPSTSNLRRQWEASGVETNRLVLP